MRSSAAGEPGDRSKCLYNYGHYSRSINSNRVSQRPAKVFEGNRHQVAILQPQAVLEAEHVGAEKMDVHVAWPAVFGMLEVMVLEISQRMAHPSLAAGLWRLPDHFSATFDCCTSWQIVELRLDHELWPQGAVAQFRFGQVEVVFRLQHVVGELVPLREADAIGRAVAADQVDTGNLGFLAAVESMGRDVERLIVRSTIIPVPL